MTLAKGKIVFLDEYRKISVDSKNESNLTGEDCDVISFPPINLLKQESLESIIQEIESEEQYNFSDSFCEDEIIESIDYNCLSDEAKIQHSLRTGRIDKNGVHSLYEAEPSNPTALIGKATVYFLQHNLRTSNIYSSKALNIEPDNSDALKLYLLSGVYCLERGFISEQEYKTHLKNYLLNHGDKDAIIETAIEYYGSFGYKTNIAQKIKEVS
jgi:hypothetical protein